jgi:hypothetical protein
MKRELIVSGWNNNIKHIDVALLFSDYLGISSAWLRLKLEHDMGRQKV